MWESPFWLCWKSKGHKVKDLETVVGKHKNYMTENIIQVKRQMDSWRKSVCNSYRGESCLPYVHKNGPRNRFVFKSTSNPVEKWAKSVDRWAIEKENSSWTYGRTSAWLARSSMDNSPERCAFNLSDQRKCRRFIYMLCLQSHVTGGLPCPAGENRHEWNPAKDSSRQSHKHTHTRARQHSRWAWARQVAFVCRLLA